LSERPQSPPRHLVIRPFPSTAQARRSPSPRRPPSPGHRRRVSCGGATYSVSGITAMSVTGLSAASGYAGDSVTITGTSSPARPQSPSPASLRRPSPSTPPRRSPRPSNGRRDRRGHVTGPAGTVSGPSFRVLPSVVLNEVAAAGPPGTTTSSSCAAKVAGNLGGIALVEDRPRPTPTGLCSRDVALPGGRAGDLVVIHLNSPPATTETSAKTDCTDPACSAGAWDVVASGTIAFGDTVLEVQASSGQPIDAVPFVSTAVSPVPATFTTSYQGLGLGLWTTACSARVRAGRSTGARWEPTLRLA